MKRSLDPSTLIPSTTAEPSGVIELGANADLKSESVAAAMAELGMAGVSMQTIVAARKVGLNLREMGVVTIGTGYIAMTAQALNNAIINVNNQIAVSTDPAVTAKLLYPLGYLADKQSKTVLALQKIQATDPRPEEKPGQKKHKSFAPGAVVQVNVNNYPPQNPGPPAIPV